MEQSHGAKRICSEKHQVDCFAVKNKTITTIGDFHEGLHLHSQYYG